MNLILLSKDSSLTFKLCGARVKEVKEIICWYILISFETFATNLKTGSWKLLSKKFLHCITVLSEEPLWCPGATLTPDKLVNYWVQSWHVCIYFKLVHETGLAGLSFKFFFPVPPGTGTDSGRWYWLYNWPGQPPAEQSRRLIRHAEPSVNIAHNTYDTHSVAVLNLSWQHSGKLIVFCQFLPFSI